MEVLRKTDLINVTGGEIIPGYPSTEIQYINVKLAIIAGRNQPGFDIGSAIVALIKVGANDFWNPDVALEYVRNGNIPIPS